MIIIPSQLQGYLFNSLVSLKSPRKEKNTFFPVLILSLCVNCWCISCYISFLSIFTSTSGLFSNWETFLIFWWFILHLEVFLIFCPMKMLSLFLSFFQFIQTQAYCLPASAPSWENSFSGGRDLPVSNLVCGGIFVVEVLDRLEILTLGLTPRVKTHSSLLVSIRRKFLKKIIIH